ncbi:MAG: hypothetical protein LBK25_05320 [Treponema sp.]|jgi:hypothetical protein|nr:hypothetical protein [Treponema sp.]
MNWRSDNDNAWEIIIRSDGAYLQKKGTAKYVWARYDLETTYEVGTRIKFSAVLKSRSTTPIRFLVGNKAGQFQQIHVETVPDGDWHEINVIFDTIRKINQFFVTTTDFNGDESFIAFQSLSVEPAEPAYSVSPEKRHNWVVMCGALRARFEFYIILSKLVELRTKGVFEGIVLSTWIGEIEECDDGLREKLNQLNIVLVEQKCPDEYDIINPNFMRQATQFSAALDVLPPDIFVLRARTDMALPALNKFAPLIDNNIDLSVKRFGNFPVIFKYRVLIEFSSLYCPLTGIDLMFYGHKDDLRRMTVFEATSFTCKTLGAPDFLWFLQAFWNAFPILREYTRCINIWFGWRDVGPYAYFPSFLNKVYATELLVMYSHFLMAPNDVTERLPLEFHNLFNGSKDKRIIKSWLLAIRCSSAVEDIVHGNVVWGQGFSLLHKEICRLAENGGVASFTQADYDDLIKFEDKYKIRITLRHNIRFAKTEITNFFSFNETAKLLFSNLVTKDGDSFYALLERAAAYGDINQWINANKEYLKENNSDVYFDALVTQLIYKNNSAIAQLYKSFFSGEIKTLPKAFLISIHIYKCLQRSMTAPTPDVLLSVYYAMKWFQEYGTASFDCAEQAKLTYKAFSKSIAGHEENELPENWAMAIVDFMDERVSRDYTKFNTDAAVKNAILALSEIGEYKGFSHDVIAYLETADKSLHRIALTKGERPNKRECENG